MKKLQLLALFFLGMTTICLTSCSDKEDTNPDDKCGAGDIWQSTSLLNTTNELVLTDRYLYFEDAGTPSDICADNAVVAFFRVTPVGGTEISGLTSIQGKLYWGLTEEKYVTLVWKSDANGIGYYGSVDGDLKSFFDKAPGWVGATIIFKMPSQGTATDDLFYISSAVASQNIDINYNHY